MCEKHGIGNLSRTDITFKEPPLFGLKKRALIKTKEEFVIILLISARRERTCWIPRLERRL
jgi:hypothetical protein